MSSDLQKAIEIFNKGGIVIFPTDTAFGIGCRMDNVKAIKRLFKLRKRPVSQATPVLISGLEMAKDYLQPVSSEVIDKLVNPYWPGALTIVLPCDKNKVFPLIRGGGENIGVRMPNYSPLLTIIETLGVPILGPSANFHGQVTPYRYEDLSPSLIALADFVLKGDPVLKQVSTVVDCSKNPWKILRKGAIDINI